MAAKAKHREAIVQAAATLFRRQGYAATGTNEIVGASENGGFELDRATTRHLLMYGSLERRSTSSATPVNDVLARRA